MELIEVKMDLWNQKNILPPPTNTYKTSDKSLDLAKFRNALQSGSQHFKSQFFLKKEAVLLSRIIYRMKMKFRSSKDFKLAEKVNHALKIFFSINMERDFKNLLNLIPSNYGKYDTYLPTKNMLSYILVRLQGLAKLMVRIYDTCIIAAEQLNKRLILGHFWNIALILFALISRIFILVKFTTKFICELYGKLKSHLGKLRNSGVDWLPKDYELPNDLYEWLGVQWVYEEDYINLTLESTPKIIDFFDLANDEDDDVQFCDEYVVLDDEESSIIKDFKQLLPLQSCITRNRMRGFSISENDIGEEISDLHSKTSKGSEIIFIPDTPNANSIINDNTVIALDTTDTEDRHADSVMYVTEEDTTHEERDMDDIGEEIVEVKDSPKTSIFKTPTKRKPRVLTKNQTSDLEMKEDTKDASLYIIEDDQESVVEVKNTTKGNKNKKRKSNISSEETHRKKVRYFNISSENLNYLNTSFGTKKKVGKNKVDSLSHSIKQKHGLSNKKQTMDLELKEATEDASLYIIDDEQASIGEVKKGNKNKKRKGIITLEETPRKSLPNISSENINYLNTSLGNKKGKNKVKSLSHSIVTLEPNSSVKKKDKNSLKHTSFVNNQTPLQEIKSIKRKRRNKNINNSPNIFVNPQTSRQIEKKNALKIKKKNKKKKNSGLQSNFKETTKMSDVKILPVKIPKNKRKSKGQISAKKKRKF